VEGNEEGQGGGGRQANNEIKGRARKIGGKRCRKCKEAQDSKMKKRGRVQGRTQQNKPQLCWEDERTRVESIQTRIYIHTHTHTQHIHTHTQNRAAERDGEASKREERREPKRQRHCPMRTRCRCVHFALPSGTSGFALCMQQHSCISSLSLDPLLRCGLVSFDCSTSLSSTPPPIRSVPRAHLSIRQPSTAYLVRREHFKPTFSYCRLTILTFAPSFKAEHTHTHADHILDRSSKPWALYGPHRARMSAAATCSVPFFPSNRAGKKRIK